MSVRRAVSRKSPLARKRAARKAYQQPDDRVLQPLDIWKRQAVKLQEWRDRVANNATMQGETWKAGQLRHIDGLIAAHANNKPQ